MIFQVYVKIQINLFHFILFHQISKLFYIQRTQSDKNLNNKFEEKKLLQKHKYLLLNLTEINSSVKFNINMCK